MELQNGNGNCARKQTLKQQTTSYLERTKCVQQIEGEEMKENSVLFTEILPTLRRWVRTPSKLRCRNENGGTPFSWCVKLLYIGKRRALIPRVPPPWNDVSTLHTLEWSFVIFSSAQSLAGSSKLLTWSAQCRPFSPLFLDFCFHLLEWCDLRFMAKFTHTWIKKDR